MNGLLFPGQGSQVVGMGYELYQSCNSARQLLDSSNDILGYDLKSLMLEGPIEQLTNTKFLQPAIYTCSAMYLEKLKVDGICYDYVAGHSLGEYDALLAANVFDFATGLKLVSHRGLAMSLMNGNGTMAAVLGMSEEELQEYMVPGVVMANINSLTQIVISGDENGIDVIQQKLSSKDGIKIKKLLVSAAFHSPQMQEAADNMKQIINSTPFSNPTCYVIPNVTGRPTKDVIEIKENLIKQITGQVRWYDSIISMKDAGVELLYEVGYGDVLKKLCKTITFRPKCIGVEV